MMEARPGSDDVPLVPDRSCGACTVCCVALTIDDPELQKPQGYRCRNIPREGGCAIYASRPQTCRAFFCGWRQLKWVRASLRPDLSGVLVRFDTESEAAGIGSRMGVVVTLLNRAALKADGLAETVAAAVAADVPLFLEILGPPGFTYGRAEMNGALSAAVHAKDKAAVLHILRYAYARGRFGKRRHVTFANRPHQPAGPN